MLLEEKIARIYAKSEGFDPDSAHFETVFHKGASEIDGKAIPLTELKDTGKKKYELYLERAKANIEIYKLLRMDPTL